MPDHRYYRRGSIVGALLLIALGALFLYSTLHPEVNPWPLLARYWPLLLIALGLGKLADYFYVRSHPELPRMRFLTGGEVAILIVLIVFAAAMTHHRGLRYDSGRAMHKTQTVDRQGAQSVNVHVKMGAGELRMSSLAAAQAGAPTGGASAAHLLDATFDYDENEGTPQVDYDVAGGKGRLEITQRERSTHFGDTRNDWDLRLAGGVPMDLQLDLGAGQGNLNLGGLAVSSVEIQQGVGQLNLDLRGDWKQDVSVNIQGGVGQATVRLPQGVGVRAEVSGGIGSIDVSGLERDGDAWVNEAYGHSPVTIRLQVHGGIGQIQLIAER